jgi:hypothetical protein
MVAQEVSTGSSSDRALFEIQQSYGLLDSRN